MKHIRGGSKDRAAMNVRREVKRRTKARARVVRCWNCGKERWAGIGPCGNCGKLPR